LTPSASRIVINGRFLAAQNSGVQRVARQLIAHLDRDFAATPGRFDWTLLHPPGAEPLAGLTVIRQRSLPGPPGQLWEQTSLAFAARGRLLVNLANTAPLLSGRSVVMVHDAQVFDAPQSYSAAFRAWYRFMLPRICRRATVITVSRHSAHRLAVNGVLPDASAAQVIGNGVDHILEEKSAERPSPASQRPFLLGLASDQPHKNTRLLLALAEAPALAAFDLVLVGSRLPPGAAPSSRVRLLGRLPDAELRMLYETAFAFLLPSFTEGFGLPAGEAMLCGAPVIAADSGALAEIWGGGAQLAAPDNVEAWIDAVRNLTVAASRNAWIEQGRKIAGAYTWRKAAGQLREACERAAASP